LTLADAADQFGACQLWLSVEKRRDLLTGPDMIGEARRHRSCPRV